MRRALEPTGTIFVAGELWQADTRDGTIPVGAQVVVTGYDGFCLHVRRAVPETPGPLVSASRS